MRNRNGFTLIELLVVITIMTILAGLLLPGIGKAMKQAKSNRALSEMQHLATVITQVYSEVGYYVRLEDLARTDGWTYVRRWTTADYVNGRSDGDIPVANDLSSTAGGNLDVSAMWNGPYTTYKSYVSANPTTTVSPNSGSRPIDPWGAMGNSDADQHQYRMFWIAPNGLPSEDPNNRSTWSTAKQQLIPAGAKGTMVIISPGPDKLYQCHITNFSSFNPIDYPKGDDVYYIFNAGIQ